MKSRVKRAGTVTAVLVCILAFMGLDYLVNEDRKVDPVKTDVQVMEKDTYNQYGLEQGIEPEAQPFYEDEKYIVYSDRILRKPQYDSRHIEAAEVLFENLKSLIPADVNQYLIPVPPRIAWEEGHPAEEETYKEYLVGLRAAVTGRIELLDVLPLLKEHSDEYLYFRTEEGWTARGAYYGAQLLCGSLGIDPVPLEGYEEHMYRTFSGNDKQVLIQLYGNADFYNKLDDMPGDPVYMYLLPGGKNRARRALNNDDVLEIDNIKTVSKARVGKATFIGTWYQWAMLEGDGLSNAKEAKTALVISDENGHAAAPFLANYYEQVYVLNMTYSTITIEEFQNVFQEYDVSDVIVLQSAEDVGDASKDRFMKKLYRMQK